MPADGFFVDILLMFIAFLCCMLNACKFALKMPIWDSLPLYSSILVLIGAGYGKFLIPCVVTRPGHEIWLLCLMPVLFSTLRLPLAYANYRRCSFALIFRRSCTYSNHFYTDTPRLSEGRSDQTKPEAFICGSQASISWNRCEIVKLRGQEWHMHACQTCVKGFCHWIRFLMVTLCFVKLKRRKRVFLGSNKYLPTLHKCFLFARMTIAQADWSLRWD